MAMKRVLPEPEGYRAQVRQIVYARVRKAGWEYPPGMDLKIMQHWGRAESAQLAAKSLCAEYFPSENAEFEKLPLCLVCQGDGSGLTPGGKKTRTSWCDGCGGTGRVR